MTRSQSIKEQYNQFKPISEILKRIDNEIEDKKHKCKCCGRYDDDY